jgi:hypothetical protein
VLDPIGRLAFDGGQAAQDRIGMWRHGIRHRRGSNAAEPEASE